MRRFLAPAVLVVALLLPAELAGACSCALLTPEDKLEGSKAAFIGRVVKKTLLGRPDRPIGEVYRYRIRVGHSLKRPLGRWIKIRALTQTATCGFEWDKGARVAAYLYGRRGNWKTGSCGLESPRVMRRLKRDLAQESVSRPRPPRSRRSTCR